MRLRVGEHFVHGQHNSYVVLVQNVHKPSNVSHLKGLRPFGNSAVKAHDSQAYIWM